MLFVCFQFTFERTQSNTWLEDHHFVDVYKLSKRLNRITGLQVTSPLVEKVETQLPSSFNEHLPFVESEALQVGLIMLQQIDIFHKPIIHVL